MKKNIIITLLAFIFFIMTSHAQEAIHNEQIIQQNSWYVEFGGPGVIGLTFNYERYLSNKPAGLSFRIGVGGGPSLGFTESGFFGVAPVGINYNIPVSTNKKHFIETGLCYTFITGEPGFASALVSWRYVSKSNTLLKVTVMPLMYFPDTKDYYSPWVGFSIGKRF